jgi:CRISPR-associated protein Cas2
MSQKGDKFMWLMVMFDLPVKTKRQRGLATRFRNFLLKDGYMRMQYSVYGRVCNGQERVEKHLNRLEDNLPPQGNIRALQMTDRQMKHMKFLLGKPEKNSLQDRQCSTKQLFLF